MNLGHALGGLVGGYLVVDLTSATGAAAAAAVVGQPKSDAGVWDVAVPPHVLPAVCEHLAALP